MGSGNRTRDNGTKLNHKKFCLIIRKCFFSLRMAGHLNNLHIEGVESLSMEKYES